MTLNLIQTHFLEIKSQVISLYLTSEHGLAINEEYQRGNATGSKRKPGYKYKGHNMLHQFSLLDSS